MLFIYNNIFDKKIKHLKYNEIIKILTGDNMAAWERLYDEEILNKSKDVKFKNVKKEKDSIIAQIADTDYEITTNIIFKSPYNTVCDCDMKTKCEHDAALHHYIDNHPELLSTVKDAREIIEDIDGEDLKKFILEEIEQNIALNNKFLLRFDENDTIDKDKYRQKLSKAIRTGEGHDFYLHQLYDIGKMEKALTKFMQKDLKTVLEADEYEFACELLCKIADVLDDELETSDDSWYNLTTIYSEIACPLIESIYLTSDDVEELELKTEDLIKYL